MLKIKLCGVTSVRDAALCIDEGAHYLGFIFTPRSPRHVDVATVKRILKSIPKRIVPVAVFMDQPVDTVRGILKELRIPIAQLHGRETPSYAQRVGCPIIKVFDTFSKRSLSKLSRYDTYAFMLDLPKNGAAAQIDPQFAVNAKLYGRVFLSGRLTRENVGALVRQVDPYGVDCCTATEKSPGVKDRERIRSFIEAVRKSEHA